MQFVLLTLRQRMRTSDHEYSGVISVIVDGRTVSVSARSTKSSMKMILSRHFDCVRIRSSAIDITEHVFLALTDAWLVTPKLILMTLPSLLRETSIDLRYFVHRTLRQVSLPTARFVGFSTA